MYQSLALISLVIMAAILFKIMWSEMTEYQDYRKLIENLSEESDLMKEVNDALKELTNNFEKRINHYMDKVFVLENENSRLHDYIETQKLVIETYDKQLKDSQNQLNDHRY